jgi:hypothetical protein
VLDQAELDGAQWVPREMRHSFVSVLSERGIPSRTSCGWSATAARPLPRPSTACRSVP